MSSIATAPAVGPRTGLIRAAGIRKLTTLGLIGATFFMVSGGPFGLEELVGNAGYARSVVILLVLPLIWSFPTALMVSELSGAIPLDGGYYVWVRRGLGPFWGFQEAWLSMTASVFDLALYPTIFILYASRLWPALQDQDLGLAAGVLMIATCTLWNLRGAHAIGASAVVMGVVLLTPFLIMSAMMFLGPSNGNAVSLPGGGTLLTGILVGMWNFMGWDNASTVAAEVENPQKTYSRAMLASGFLVAIAYLIPVAACWYAGIDSANWTTGEWADVAGQVGGKWLFVGVIIGGMLFGIGLFNSLAMSYTRVPFAMAGDRWLPSAFAKVNRFGVPWVSVLVCGVAWMAALSLGFVNLIELDVTIYGLSLLLEFAALIALRIKEPGLARPFRIPGGIPGAIALAVGPTVLIALAVVDSMHQQISVYGWEVNNLALGLLLVALGPLQYWVVRRSRPGTTDQAA